MLIDMHYHASEELWIDKPRRPGCLVSRRFIDNPRVVRNARAARVNAAVYVRPHSAAVDDVLGHIADDGAMPYFHPESYSRSCWDQVEPIVCLSGDLRRPILIHLSRHDSRAFPRQEAAWWLERILSAHSNLTAIVSHLGGENLFEAIASAQRNPNVLMDTSCLHETAQRSGWIVEGLLAWLSDTIDANSLLYGSDDDISRGAVDLRGYAAIRKAFSPEDCEKVFSQNSLRFAVADALVPPTRLDNWQRRSPGQTRED